MNGFTRSLLTLIGMSLGVCPSVADTITAEWSSYAKRSAIGELDGTLIAAATSSASEFIGIIDGRFASDNWQADFGLTDAATSLAVQDANMEDTHTFVFLQPIEELLFYVESFDSNSVAMIVAEGEGEISLVDSSPSVSFDAMSPLLGTLTATNRDANGEGDAVFKLAGSISSVSMDFISGDGPNRVFYTFAVNLPEPNSSTTMLLGSLLLFRWRKPRR